MGAQLRYESAADKHLLDFLFICDVRFQLLLIGSKCLRKCRVKYNLFIPATNKVNPFVPSETLLLQFQSDEPAEKPKRMRPAIRTNKTSGGLH